MQDKNSPRQTFWLKTHRYLALSLGFFFVFVGLSGSLGVYGDALDLWLNPKLGIEKPKENPLSLDRILSAVRAAHPQRLGSWTLEMPRTRDGMLTAWYESPRETQGRFYAPLMVSVNPYTAEVVASRFWGETATTRLLDLHTQLGIGQMGRNWAGSLGLALMVSLTSGLFSWRSGLKRASTLNRDAGIGRLALDIHRVIGLIVAIPLLFLAFTGVNLAFPRIAESLAGTSGMGHGDEGPAVRSSAMPNDRPVGLEEAVLLARGPFPHAEVRWVATPEGETGTYRVTLRQAWEVNRRHPYTTVWVDQYSGQIREVRNPARFNAAATALTWLWPLHTGEAFGANSRLPWFFAGLAPLALFLAGLLSWLARRRIVRDFPVDFTPLRLGLGHSVKLASFRTSRLIFRAASWMKRQAVLFATAATEEIRRRGPW